MLSNTHGRIGVLMRTHHDDAPMTTTSDMPHGLNEPIGNSLLRDTCFLTYQTCTEAIRHVANHFEMFHENVDHAGSDRQATSRTASVRVAPTLNALDASPMWAAQFMLEHKMVSAAEQDAHIATLMAVRHATFREELASTAILDIILCQLDLLRSTQYTSSHAILYGVTDNTLTDTTCHKSEHAQDDGMTWPWPAPLSTHDYDRTYDEDMASFGFNDHEPAIVSASVSKDTVESDDASDKGNVKNVDALVHTYQQSLWDDLIATLVAMSRLLRIMIRTLGHDIPRRRPRTMDKDARVLERTTAITSSSDLGDTNPSALFVLDHTGSTVELPPSVHRVHVTLQSYCKYDALPWIMHAAQRYSPFLHPSRAVASFTYSWDISRAWQWFQGVVWFCVRHNDTSSALPNTIVSKFLDCWKIALWTWCRQARRGQSIPSEITSLLETTHLWPTLYLSALHGSFVDQWTQAHEDASLLYGLIENDAYTEDVDGMTCRPSQGPMIIAASMLMILTSPYKQAMHHVQMEFQPLHLKTHRTFSLYTRIDRHVAMNHVRAVIEEKLSSFTTMVVDRKRASCKVLQDQDTLDFCDWATLWLPTAPNIPNMTQALPYDVDAHVAHNEPHDHTLDANTEPEPTPNPRVLRDCMTTLHVYDTMAIRMQGVHPWWLRRDSQYSTRAALDPTVPESNFEHGVWASMDEDSIPSIDREWFMDRVPEEDAHASRRLAGARWNYVQCTTPILPVMPLGQVHAWVTRCIAHFLDTAVEAIS